MQYEDCFLTSPGDPGGATLWPLCWFSSFMQVKQQILLQCSNTVKEKCLIVLSEVIYVYDPADMFNLWHLLITALLEIHKHFVIHPIGKTLILQVFLPTQCS